MTHEMEKQVFTVKQVAQMANVTMKTLHHYDAIGLLQPAQVSEAGYRLYGHAELERLQQILFYRELGIPLKQIQALLAGVTERKEVLAEQRELLLRRQRQLTQLVQTIDLSISHAARGEIMDTNKMFNGFATEDEWKKALASQDKHLKDKYGAKIAEGPIDVESMNKSAKEAKEFMDFMADALRRKVPVQDDEVVASVKKHLNFVGDQGHKASPQDFTKQTKFFLQDEFHRNMLEDQQVGLAYYLSAAAEAYAAL